MSEASLPNIYVGDTEFIEFAKIPRLSRDCVITEKIDGTNAQILIGEDGSIKAGSRSRWITPGKSTDNYGFAGWVEANKEELLKLGPGRHFGEWWGLGINRGYGLAEKRLSMFNPKWTEQGPMCVSVVPVLYTGPFGEYAINLALQKLEREGSAAAPGFMEPEGIVIWHSAARMYFKKTIKNDNAPKGDQNVR